MFEKALLSFCLNIGFIFSHALVVYFDIKLYHFFFVIIEIILQKEKKLERLKPCGRSKYRGIWRFA